MKLNEVPKYATMATVMQLTPRQRQILYRQCKAGRSCYLVDVNQGNGSFFESCFDYRGVFVGDFLTHKYMAKIWKEMREESSIKEKAFEIIKDRKMDLSSFNIYTSASHYNRYHEHPITQEEYDLLMVALHE